MKICHESSRRGTHHALFYTKWHVVGADMPPLQTFKCISCSTPGPLQVAALQKQGLLARDSVVSEVLRMLAPTPSPQRSCAAHAHPRAAKQDVPAEHAAEHVQALRAVSMASPEQGVPDQAHSPPHQQAAMNGDRQDVAEANSSGPAQSRGRGRWSWPQPLLKPSTMAPKHPLALGSPVPSEAEMSKQLAVHATAMAHLLSSCWRANGSPDITSV